MPQNWSPMGNSRRSDGLDLLGSISQLERTRDVRELRRQVARLMSTIGSNTDNKIRLRTNGRERSMSSVSRQFLLGELQQIEKTKTAERARYYASRLMKALGEVNTGEFNVASSLPCFPRSMLPAGQFQSGIFVHSRCIAFAAARWPCPSKAARVSRR